MVHFAVFLYNCSPLTSTGLTPFFLNHGREPNLPLNIIFVPEDGTNAEIEDYQQFLTQQMKKVLSVVDKRQQKLKNKQKKQYDKSAVDKLFAVNNLVYLKHHNFGQLSTDKNNTKKLSFLYEGPYKIIKIPSAQTAKIAAIFDSDKISVLHFNNLKLKQPLDDQYGLTTKHTPERLYWQKTKWYLYGRK